MEFSDLGIKTDLTKEQSYTTCPECSHDRKKKNEPCLTVHNETGNRWFKCHHCGYSGNLEIMGRYDKVRKNAMMPKNIGPGRAFGVDFSKYISKRGLSSRTLSKEGIYETSDGKLIGFPYYQGQTLVNVKFYVPKPKPPRYLKWFQMKQEHGTKVCFLGMQNISIDKTPPHLRDHKNTVIITEGEWDFLTWKEVGKDNVLSVPMGAPAENAKDFRKEFQYIHDDGYFKGMAKHIDLFYLSVDDDSPGHLLKEHLAKILGPHKCMVVNYPDGYKDINEVLIGDEKKQLPALGKEGVLQCYRNAKAYPIKGIISISQLSDDLELFQKTGLTAGLKIGVPEIDWLFTVKRKHLSFWTGIPGMGKTVALRWYLIKLLLNNPDEDLKFALFTPENRPPAREIVKMAELLVGKRYMEGRPDSMTDKEREHALNFIRKHFFIISPDRFNFESFEGEIGNGSVNSTQSIFNYISYLAKTHNIFGYVIDAFNKLDNEQPRNRTETQYVSQILDYFIDFNEAHNVHGYIVAHPTKTSKDSNGNYMMPALYDIAGSRAWYEKADIGLIMHRYKYMVNEDASDDGDDLKYKARTHTPLYVKCEKIRFEELGNIGITRLNIDRYSNFTVHPDDVGKHLQHVTEDDTPGEQEIRLWDDDDNRDPLGGDVPNDLPF